ncbi:MAG: hypothetical protein HKP58_14195, partial [Desulfatitalea sp.]|nr:hypothetical protein [Desulfatitalea sp.]NNK01555.1 hypothetical protein [Desulfatitalea sp.]
MTRKRPLASLNLIQIIFLSLLLLACGGSTAIEDSINDAVDDVIDTLPECVFDDDCDDGSICSSSGQCLAAIEETDGAGDEPKASGCQAEAPTGAVLYVAVEGSDGAEADGSAALPFASITHALDQA